MESIINLSTSYSSRGNFTNDLLLISFAFKLNNIIRIVSHATSRKFLTRSRLTTSPNQSVNICSLRRKKFNVETNNSPLDMNRMCERFAFVCLYVHLRETNRRCRRNFSCDVTRSVVNSNRFSTRAGERDNDLVSHLTIYSSFLLEFMAWGQRRIRTWRERLHN